MGVKPVCPVCALSCLAVTQEGAAAGSQPCVLSHLSIQRWELLCQSTLPSLLQTLRFIKDGRSESSHSKSVAEARQEDRSVSRLVLLLHCSELHKLNSRHSWPFAKSSLCSRCPGPGVPLYTAGRCLSKAPGLCFFFTELCP